MAKGRKAVPAEQMLARGTRAKHKRAAKHAKTATAARMIAKTPPIDLEKPARKYWTQIVERISPLGILKSSDFITLMMLCETLAEYRQCCAEITEAGGLTYEAASYVSANAATAAADDDADEGVVGSRLIRAHPAVMIRRRARQDIVNLCEKLGLTPSSRFALLKEAAQGYDGMSPPAGVRPAAMQQSEFSQETMPHDFH